METCKKGQYYCNTDKKCKPIPDGHTVREDGFLVKEAKRSTTVVRTLNLKGLELTNEDLSIKKRNVLFVV